MVASKATITNRSNVRNPLPPPPQAPPSQQRELYYGDYLKIPSLLDLQHPKSTESGVEVHDETLFIIIHQVYELWFKQIIHELKSVKSIFSQEFIAEEALSTVSSTMHRVNKIQSLLNQQLEIIETMSPMDFLEFRNLLMPASGFQSVQFREIEIMMGLSALANFKGKDTLHFLNRFSPGDRRHLEEVVKQPSLLELLEKWLVRTPFLTEGNFHFWQEYHQVVQGMLKQDRSLIEANRYIDEKQRKAQLTGLDATSQTFDSLFNTSIYQQQMQQGKRFLSQKAMLGALFIFLYRERPMLTMPYQVLNSLVDLDEALTAWRYRHALMAHRMLGSKIGTGGTSGHHYLKMVADNGRVFTDLFDLSSFLVPKSHLPQLPEELKRKLNFYHQD